MKKQLSRLIAIVLIAFSSLAITQMAVYAQDKNKVNLLKTSEETYIIYAEDTINTEFLFCFSEKTEVEEDELTFSAAGTDTNGAYVAYMTKEQAQKLPEGKTYMWVKANSELTKYEINLKEAVTSEEIEFVNSTTKRIEVETSGSKNTSEEVEGVKITHSQGKVILTEEGSSFSYYIEKVSSEETTNFVELANQIMNSENLSNYERLTLVKQFANAYANMFEGIENWVEVPENKEILQPQEAKKDDIYLVWLKNEQTEENDVQILLCDDHQDIEVEEAKKVTVYDVTKLPVTFDTIITLIITLIILVAIIAILVIVKKKLNKKED